MASFLFSGGWFDTTSSFLRNQITKNVFRTHFQFQIKFICSQPIEWGSFLSLSVEIELCSVEMCNKFLPAYTETKCGWKKSKNILQNKYRKEKDDAFCLISKKAQRTLIRLAVGQGLSRWRKRRSAHTGGVLRPQWLTGWRTGNLRCWRRSLRQLLTENGQNNFFSCKKHPLLRERKKKYKREKKSMHACTNPDIWSRPPPNWGRELKVCEWDGTGACWLDTSFRLS